MALRDQLLRFAGERVKLTLYDQDGTETAAGGAVTATVIDSAGGAVAGSPFATTETGTSNYHFDVPAELGVLDAYDVVWNLPGGTKKRYSQFELVGTHIFEIPELTSYKSELGSIAADTARLARLITSQVFEHERVGGGHAFRLRGRRELLSGCGHPTLFVKGRELQTILSAKVDGIALTSEELAELETFPSGKIVWDGGFWDAGVRNVEILYEYGFQVPPEDVKRAALRYAQHLILSGPATENERATAMFTEIGAYRLTIAGRDGRTGLPEVDAVLETYRGSAGMGFA